MGYYVSLKCPHCNSLLFRGRGREKDFFPKICVPFFRCRVCGELIKTPSREFLTIPVEERIKMRNSLNNCKEIAESLDRTNCPEYVDFLHHHGFDIYQISDLDKQKFLNVSFDNHINQEPTEKALDELYSLQILLKEDEKDENGELKQEIIENNKKEYNKTSKANIIGTICGLITGLIAFMGFGMIEGASFLAVLAIPCGLGVHFLVAGAYYKFFTQEENAASDNEDTNDNNETNNSSATKPHNESERDFANEEKCDKPTYNNFSQEINTLKNLLDENIITKDQFIEGVQKYIK